MLCREAMKTNLQCLSATDTIQNAARRMRDSNVGFMPVCDQDKKVIGTVTDRDITVRVVADGRPGTTAASDVMTREVVACKPNDDIQCAKEAMAKHRKSRVLVCDDQGKLVGVISLSDIAQKSDAGDTLRKVTSRESRA